MRIISIIVVVVVIGIPALLTFAYHWIENRDAEARQTSQIFVAQETLWNMGYGGHYPSKTWNEEAVYALSVYQFDWGLQITDDLIGDQELPEDLQAHLLRTHAMTKSQWYSVDGTECFVWNQLPQPQEIVTWSGDCKNGKASGQGRLVWRYQYYGDPIEDVFEGWMSGGNPNGKGSYIFAFGDRYDGEFLDGKYDGQGVYADNEGSVYTGAFKDDLPQGLGRLVNWDGNVYEGVWNRGCLSTMTTDAYFLTTPEVCGFKVRFSFWDLLGG